MFRKRRDRGNVYHRQKRVTVRAKDYGRMTTKFDKRAIKSSNFSLRQGRSALPFFMECPRVVCGLATLQI